MSDDVRTEELSRRLGEDARDVEGDIAIADHHRAVAGQVGIEAGEIGMAIVPSDEGGTAMDIGEVLAGEAQLAIMRRTRRQHHRVVDPAKLVDRDILADGDIADETDVVVECDSLVASGHRLDRLVVWRHPGPDQPVGHRQAVEDIDPDIRPPLLDGGFRSVISGRTGAYDGDAGHRVSLHSVVPPFKAGCQASASPKIPGSAADCRFPLAGARSCVRRMQSIEAIPASLAQSGV